MSFCKNWLKCPTSERPEVLSSDITGHCSIAHVVRGILSPAPCAHSWWTTMMDHQQGECLIHVTQLGSTRSHSFLRTKLDPWCELCGSLSTFWERQEANTLLSALSQLQFNSWSNNGCLKACAAHFSKYQWSAVEHLIISVTWGAKFSVFKASQHFNFPYVWLPWQL